MMPYPTCIAPNGHSIQPDRTIVCEHSTFQLHRPPKRDKQLQKIPNYIMHLNSIILEPRFHPSKRFHSSYYTLIYMFQKFPPFVQLCDERLAIRSDQ